jgi:hypothetical protein
MWTKTLFLAGLFTAAVGVLAANATPLDITGITGVWQNQVGGLNVSGLGTSAITWGDGVAPDSGYTFAAGGGILSAPVGVPLFLGNFTPSTNRYPSPISAPWT